MTTAICKRPASASKYAWTVMLAALALLCAARPAAAQGSRKDDVIINAQGRPLAGATVRVCTAASTGQPCSPLANLYSNQTLTQALAMIVG